MRRRAGSLGTRLAVAMVALVVLTAAVTALSGLVLVRRADDTEARRGLAMLADSVAAQVEGGADAGTVAAAVGTPTVRIAVVTGARVTGEPLARLATTTEVVDELRGGRIVSKRVSLQGVAVLVEGRPTPGGGVVLVQRRVDAGWWPASESWPPGSGCCWRGGWRAPSAGSPRPRPPSRPASAGPCRCRARVRCSPWRPRSTT